MDKYVYDEDGFIEDAASGEVVYPYVPADSGYDIAAHLSRLQHQLEGAVHFINVAVEIMTPEQVGQWTGVRAFLESLE